MVIPKKSADQLVIDLIHRNDDFEQLRSKVQHSCSVDIELLTEALYALKAGKGHVVRDHMERVLFHIQDLYGKVKALR